MIVLNDIIKEVSFSEAIGKMAVPVTGLATDSRLVQTGFCFLAIRGTHTDGHLFIDKAIDLGAKVIVCEQMPSVIQNEITYLKVEDSAHAAGLIAHAFYGNVTLSMKVVGVTGTNGKTTIATLLFKLFSAMGYTCGLISTVQYQIADQVFPSTHTTPDVIRLHHLLFEMKKAGCTHVFMECSSHAIHQQRLSGIAFAGAIFSNITHDHLDYHSSFDEYIRVKKSYFDTLPSGAFAISNLDDKRGEVMLQNTKAKKYYYSLRSVADVKGKILENGLNGLHMLINQDEVHFRLTGSFNASNLLAVYGAAVCLGEPAERVLQILSGLDGAEGRFDTIRSSKDQILGIVDYAHTPDALENVLKTILQLRSSNEKVFTVVGCGGDRDKSKRAVMGQVAAELSDVALFTSDNPRSEDPNEIVEQMKESLTSSAKRKVMTNADRREAIKTAVSLAGRGDIILVAGKGHEKYQEIKGVRYLFDDKQVLNEMFSLLEK
jgi:UDP-N-acetylmuramoyl-L-alanyl-D-glutamate--2,6-diaminopimelate ligase